MLRFIKGICEQRREKERLEHPELCLFKKGTSDYNYYAGLKARDLADASHARRIACEHDKKERAELELIATLQSIEDGKIAAALSKVDDERGRRSRVTQYCVGCLRIPLPGTFGRANGSSAAAAVAAVSI